MTRRAWCAPRGRRLGPRPTRGLHRRRQPHRHVWTTPWTATRMCSTAPSKARRGGDMGLGSLTRIAGRAVTNAGGNERRCRPGRLAGTPARTRERIAASCATGWISARTRRDHCALTSVILAASTAHAACTSTAPEPARFASLVSPRRRRQWFPQTRPRRGRRRARRRARRQARRRARRRARRLHQRRAQRRARRLHQRRARRLYQRRAQRRARRLHQRRARRLARHPIRLLHPRARRPLRPLPSQRRELDTAATSRAACQGSSATRRSRRTTAKHARAAATHQTLTCI